MRLFSCRLALVVLGLGSCFPLGLLAQPSPLVGKPLPELELSHPLQGDAWSPGKLLGSVIVLDVFQLG